MANSMVFFTVFLRLRAAEGVAHANFRVSAKLWSCYDCCLQRWDAGDALVRWDTVCTPGGKGQSRDG